MAGPDGGAAGMVVRRPGDGTLSARCQAGAGRTPGRGWSDRGQNQPVVCDCDGGVSRSRGHRRCPFWLAWRPVGPNPGHVPERPHLRDLQRPVRLRQRAGSSRGLAFPFRPGHGGRMVAGRRPGDGDLAESLPSLARRHDPAPPATLATCSSLFSVWGSAGCRSNFTTVCYPWVCRQPGWNGSRATPAGES